MRAWSTANPSRRPSELLKVDNMYAMCSQSVGNYVPQAVELSSGVISQSPDLAVGIDADCMPREVRDAAVRDNISPALHLNAEVRHDSNLTALLARLVAKTVNNGVIQTDEGEKHRIVKGTLNANRQVNLRHAGLVGEYAI